MKILLAAGARPNFMKIAPLIHELEAVSRDPQAAGRELRWKVVHTGQHYDCEMSKVFFEDFDLPEPDYFLNSRSGSQAEQTAKIMVEFEKVCLREKPEVVVIVGDVNSTLACSLAAKKLNIKVAHVEAGLRSGDMTMPEEINRIVTDSISDYLFVTERSGIDNLRKEGKRDDQIFFVGNIMIDTLLRGLRKIDGKGRAGQFRTFFGVVTLHRPSNVDDKEKLTGIMEALRDISKEMPLFFPIHPRTGKNLERFGMKESLKRSNIMTMPPLSYLEFLSLWRDASLVFTDSGGLQEETTALGIPCFTIRDNTERPITIEEGTNVLVGTSKEKILRAYHDLRKSGGGKEGMAPELWDGKTAKRIISTLLKAEKTSSYAGFTQDLARGLQGRPWSEAVARGNNSIGGVVMLPAAPIAAAAVGDYS